MFALLSFSIGYQPLPLGGIPGRFPVVSQVGCPHTLHAILRANTTLSTLACTELQAHGLLLVRSITKSDKRLQVGIIIIIIIKPYLSVHTQLSPYVQQIQTTINNEKRYETNITKLIRNIKKISFQRCLKVAWSAMVSCSALLQNDIKCVY